MLQEAINKADLLLLVSDTAAFSERFKKLHSTAEITVDEGFISSVKTMSSKQEASSNIPKLFEILFDGDERRIKYELKKYEVEKVNGFADKLLILEELIEIADTKTEKEWAAARIIFCHASLGDVEALKQARDKYAQLLEG